MTYTYYLVNLETKDIQAEKEMTKQEAYELNIKLCCGESTNRWVSC